MYDMKPYLKRIDEVIEKVLIRIPGNHYHSIRHQIGIRRKSLEFLFTGAFIVFQHLEVNGILAICIFRVRQNMSTILRHMESIVSLATRISFQCLRQRSLIQMHGPSLFEEAGAQYVVPVAEHHDGFQMYKSEISHWNAYEMGPKRDVLGELGQKLQSKRECDMGASDSSYRALDFL